MIADPSFCARKKSNGHGKQSTNAGNAGQVAPVPLPLTVAETFDAPAFRKKQRTYPTGFDDLDDLLRGGFRSRKVVFLAAPTGAGKTGFVGTLAVHQARSGHPVLWITTELENEEQAARIASITFHQRELAATPDDFLAHTITPDKGKAATQGLPIYLQNLDDDPDPFTTIRAKAQGIYLATGRRPIIIIDYIQCFAVVDETAIRSTMIRNAKHCRTIGRDLDTVVIAISSTSRAYQGRNRRMVSQSGEENPLDWLTASAETSAIEYTGAVVAFLDTADEVDALGGSAARLIVAKARGGRRGFVGLRFHGPSGAFEACSGSVLAMSSANSAAKRGTQARARVLAFVRSPGYVPMTATDLRNAAQGTVDDNQRAINSLLETGELRKVPLKVANQEGALRTKMVVVAGAAPALTATAMECRQGPE